MYGKERVCYPLLRRHKFTLIKHHINSNSTWCMYVGLHDVPNYEVLQQVDVQSIYSFTSIPDRWIIKDLTVRQLPSSLYTRSPHYTAVCLFFSWGCRFSKESSIYSWRGYFPFSPDIRVALSGAVDTAITCISNAATSALLCEQSPLVPQSTVTNYSQAFPSQPSWQLFISVILFMMVYYTEFRVVLKDAIQGMEINFVGIRLVLF